MASAEQVNTGNKKRTTNTAKTDIMFVTQPL